MNMENSGSFFRGLKKALHIINFKCTDMVRCKYSLIICEIISILIDLRNLSDWSMKAGMFAFSPCLNFVFLSL